MKKIKQRAPQAQSVSDTGKLKELLYANDLMEVDYYNIIVDEAYLDFDENDYNWYEPEMVCWNDFVEEHNMKEVVPLLKGLLF
jgi:hypothetical protein